MSQEVVLHRPVSAVWPAGQSLRWLLALQGRLRPEEGWLAVLLLMGNLLVVAWSVEKVGWVETPNMEVTLILAVACGLVLSRLSAPIYLVLPLGLAVGFGLIVYQIVEFEPERSGLSSLDELWHRLDLWLEAARQGSISIDPIPFAFLLLIGTWLIGYLSAWSLFRFHNSGGVVLLGGIAIIVNLTNVSPGVWKDWVLYVFSVLLLLSRVQSVRRQREWSQRGLVYESKLGVLNLNDGLWFAVGILLVAYLLPLDQAFRPLNSAYNGLTSPVSSLSGDFNRLFAGLPGKKPRAYRDFSHILPLRGTIKNSDNPVLKIESPYPLYWKVRSYSVYTSKGWTMGDTSMQNPGWDPLLTVPQEYEKVEPVTHRVTSVFSNKNVFTGGQVVGVSRPAYYETYDSPTYTIDIRKPDWRKELPPGQRVEIGDLVLQAARNSSRGKPASFLNETLPQEWGLKGVGWHNGRPYVFTLNLAVPAPPEVLYVRPRDRKIQQGETYAVNTTVSFATDGNLRSAGEDYPAWVYARYLQLPEGLPKQVRDLAAELTSSAENPFDKAKAIERYFSEEWNPQHPGEDGPGAQCETPEEIRCYTRVIDPPPFDADGVDYFLFDLQRGYSEYFASAMTVLLRAAGVPSRLATGYNQGRQPIIGEPYIVKDNDSHAWVEAFFPTYGWISFEPTPGRSIPKLVALPPPPIPEGVSSIAVFEEEFDTDIFGLGDDGAGALSSRSGSSRQLLWLLFLLLVPGVAVAGQLAWLRFMGPSPDPQISFRRVAFLGSLGGVAPKAWQTAYQYQGALASAFPANRQDVSVIIGAYVRSLYGHKVLDEQGQQEIAQAWERLRGPLLLRIVRRG